MIAMGKISRPVIGMLPETLFSGNRTGFSEAIMNPKSPLDFKIRSPRGLQNCESGAVGLGIVAALDKSGEIPAKLIVGSLRLNHSDPIPISSSAKTSAKSGGKLQSFEIDCSENYTCVTYHEPKKSSFTKVYDNGGEDEINGHDRSNYDRNYRNLKVNCESPPIFGDTIQDFPVSDFLSSCYLCRKKLHGKDIYMYRGEKGFCSTECRYRQIVSDEKEKCRAETSRRTEISSSPIFSTGIIAA